VNAALAFAAFAWVAAGQAWKPLTSGATVSLRGISAVNENVAWASGAKGTFLKTTDGGRTWAVQTMPGAADLDFRDVEALDERTVYLLSSGAGPLSRIYKTSNGGESWALLHTNLDPKGFLDCMAFWDETHGIVVGDPAGGRFTILTTSDGVTWRKRQGPKANSGEGAFAASGSCVFTRGTREVWFGTGGAGGARVFHSTDGGETWSVAQTPVRHDSANAGIFSLAFADGRYGIAVGGDYTKPEDSTGNFAITEDGGKTWKASASGPSGYRSAVVHLEGARWIAVGTPGADLSRDGGRSWFPIDGAGYDAMSSRAGFAVGPNGAVARFLMELDK
jgi:photosystem II stability/assembly factor-like uncharacterized protein